MLIKFQVTSVSDENYCFIVVPLILNFHCSCTCSLFYGSQLCLLSIFTHSCIYLVLRTRRSSLHGMGVATPWWACTHFCSSLNKSLKKGIPSAVGFPYCAGSGEGLFLSPKPYPHKCAEAVAQTRDIPVIDGRLYRCTRPALQISRLNNSFDIKDYHVVVWLSLKIYLFGCVGWWESLFTIFIFTVLYLYLVCLRMLEFTKGLCPKFTKILIISAIYCL